MFLFAVPSGSGLIARSVNRWCQPFQAAFVVGVLSLAGGSLAAFDLAAAADAVADAGAGAVVGAGADEVSLPHLAPYRAVYEIALSDRSLSAPQPVALVSMTGRMVYELIGSPCEGYSTTQRLVTASEMAGSQISLEDVRLAGFEAAGGRSYQFVNHRHIDQALRQSVRGNARRQEGRTLLEMREPQAGQLVLEEEVLFPANWVRHLIAHAQKGQRFFSAFLFDGSDEVGVFFQTAVTIGSARTDAPAESVLEKLSGMPRWPVTVAYYPAEQSTDGMTPLYEISGEVFENGVNGSLHLDFGEYALDAVLTDITLLDNADCP